MNFDVIIIGGGAAGLMCQYHLANTGLNILLIEKNATLGKKLLLTGNGRCNVTNHLKPQEFIQRIHGQQKKFFYKAIHSFSTNDVVNFFEQRGVPLTLQDNFKYFPTSDKASDILNVLTSVSKESTIHYNESVKKLVPMQQGIEVVTDKQTYQAKNVVVATGSESFPKTGSTGDGLLFASELDIQTIPFYPAETKIYSSQIEELPLQGLQVKDANVAILHSKHQDKGDLLFTHDGLSGPVIYQLSEEIYHQLQKEKEVLLNVDLLNISKEYFHSLLSEFSSKTMETVVAKLTSKRLASTLFSLHELPKKPINSISSLAKNDVYQLLSNYRIKVQRVEDKKLAYVNGGGVITKELDPKTMQTKKYPHLYYIGETIDLHGPIGGFNITIAFATAYLAAMDIKGGI